MNYSRLSCLHQGTIKDLLLDGIQVNVSIVDVHAKVVMHQRFTNAFHTAVEAQYSITMHATSAVCGFEMIRGDGRHIVGQVKDRKSAKETYDTALAQGITTSLGEEQTKDLFAIRVGNIHASETVLIQIAFLTPLIDDEKTEQVRFTFPWAYMGRYGTPPAIEHVHHPPITGVAQDLSINVSVQMPGVIKFISCPSHLIEVSWGWPAGSSIPDYRLATVKMTANTPRPDRDFILVISAVGLDAPRCFAECSDQGSVALGLTLVPRFNIPDCKSGMEYIFVVDRSGSMQGTPIYLVKQALVILLRGLPTKQTKFNIFSFGSKLTSLWPSSMDYTQASLEWATAHIDTMDGDYGGTEIASALKEVFGTLSRDRKQPVSVFVLTDGDAWDVETCCSITRQTVSSFRQSIRVFAVGIGNSVSTDMVESIARAGYGFPMYIQANELMAGKLGRLVRASRSPAIRDVCVSWPCVEEENGRPVEAEAETVHQAMSDHLLGVG